MARYLDFSLDQGSTLTKKINYIDINKANLSLAGYSARAKMRRSHYSANAILINATISDETNGEITLSLSANTTSGLRTGRWVYDVEANTASDASVIRVVEGIITVMPGVTNVAGVLVPAGTTTSDIEEGNNLYYTNTRVWANVSSNIGNLNSWVTSHNNTTGIIEGTNLYFTNARVWANISPRLAALTTSDIAEGANLYFSNARARAALGAVGSNLVYYEANGKFQVIVSESGSASTANVTFQDNFVIGTGVGQNDGLYLAAGSGQVANLQYLRLRGGDDDAHIHFDTGNVEAYDLYLGDDNKYIKLERGYSGNIVIGSSSNYGKRWKFDINGVLEFPDNTLQSTAGLVASDININNSGYKLSSDSGNVWSGQSGVVQANDKLVGIYNATSSANNSVFTLGTNGAGATSLAVDGALFVGLAKPSNDGGVTSAFPGWLVVQSGGKFGAGVDTLGSMLVGGGVVERYSTINNANGIVEHDASQGHIFYHNTPSANWTANFTISSLAGGYGTTYTLVVNQGATGYYANAVQMAGTPVSINWIGNTLPVPSTNRLDVINFSVLQSAGGSFTVLGQLTGF